MVPQSNIGSDFFKRMIDEHKIAGLIIISDRHVGSVSIFFKP